MEVTAITRNEVTGVFGGKVTKPSSFATKMKTKLKRASNVNKGKMMENKARTFVDVSNGQLQRVSKKKQVIKPTIKESTYDLSKLKTEVDLLLESKLPQGVSDIDADERDYFNEPTYAQDIMRYLSVRESYFVVPRNYLDGKEVTHVMRSVLVDWLVQVQDHLKLMQETLHLTVAMVSHVLHRHAVPVNQLQLVGVTCLMVAAKYHERFAPEIDDLVRLTDNTYTYDDVVRMELVVLRVLRFELYIPLPCVFLDRFLKLVKDEEQVSLVCRYLLDLGLCDASLVVFPASIQAAGVLALARRLVAAHLGDTDEWTKTDAYYTGYLATELFPVMRRYIKLLQRAPTSKQQGAKNKYSSRSRYQAIAKSDIVASRSNLNRVLEAIAE